LAWGFGREGKGVEEQAVEDKSTGDSFTFCGQNLKNFMP
jgi:hypothetical protein